MAFTWIHGESRGRMPWQEGAKRSWAATKNYEEQMGSYTPPVPILIML
jgi:hypothetical protein